MNGAWNSWRFFFGNLAVDRLKLKAAAAFCGIALRSGCFHSSKSLAKLVESLTDEEVKFLVKLYPDPKKLLNELLGPILQSCNENRPEVIHQKGLYGLSWKTKIQFKWPQKFQVIGLAQSLEKAEKNAYLTACELFKILQLYEGSENQHNYNGPSISQGWLFKDNSQYRPLTKEHVLDILCVLAKQADCKNSFQFITTQESTGRESLWQTQLQVFWPFEFLVSASGTMLETTQYMVCLLASTKLKCLGLLTHSNHLKNEREKEPKIVESLPDFEPDRELYIDASLHGFGAYLLTSESSQVSWLSDVWPQNIKNNFILRNRDSTFLEMYSLVSSCYTWKHKFTDKTVVCWSDNKSVVDIVNKGLHLTRDAKSEKYQKLYQILQHTCEKHNITLFVKHLQRSHNIAADFLSRNDVQNFRETVPNTAYQSKRAKKLFYLPLVRKPIIPKDSKNRD